MELAEFCIQMISFTFAQFEMHSRIIKFSLTSWNGHLPDPDLVVAVTGEQCLSVCWPCQTETLRWLSLWRVVWWNAGAQFLDHLLACQIPNLDVRSWGNAQPVSVWRETQSVDDVIVVQSVQVLAVIQIPQESLAILASGSAKGAIRRDGNGVQVSVVSIVIQLELAVGQIPDLDGAIPTSRDDDRIDLVRRESDARNPIAVTIFLNGVLAFGQSVPQLDGLIARSWHDLTVISWESDRENILQEKWVMLLVNLQLLSISDNQL